MKAIGKVAAFLLRHKKISVPAFIVGLVFAFGFFCGLRWGDAGEAPTPPVTASSPTPVRGTPPPSLADQALPSVAPSPSLPADPPPAKAETAAPPPAPEKQVPPAASKPRAEIAAPHPVPRPAVAKKKLFDTLPAPIHMRNLIAGALESASVPPLLTGSARDIGGGDYPLPVLAPKAVASAKPAAPPAPVSPPPKPPPAGKRFQVPDGEFTARVAGDLPFSSPEDSFTLYRLGQGKGPTLLVVGGIQGDEPGGFSAASLLASRYAISAGSVWVVPDLNFSSILSRNRGASGDMNRKFAHVDAKDPDYATVMRIKSVLLDERVDIILNLHDGSGFYRPTWEDSLRNPKRWGQSLIIDQTAVDAPHFPLYDTAAHIENEVNGQLLDPRHRYYIYNTYTADGNVEMSKTLSWFAVCNGKPAFGVEASKEFTTEQRCYYHLQVVEAFMRRLGIAFARDFDLTPTGIRQALNTDLRLSAFDGKLVFALDNVRPVLNLVPFKKNLPPGGLASKPLLALVPEQKRGVWRVAYGSRTLTELRPDYMEFDSSLKALDMLLDGEARKVPAGEMVHVRESFLVRHQPGYRVNAIGAQRERNGTEADVLLKKSDFIPRYSVDRDATIFRVEIYKGKSFAGMVLVRFGKSGRPGPGSFTTVTSAEESDLGF